MRGKKYSDDIKEKAYALYATNGSFAETGKELGVPANTVSTWIKNKPPDEFDELRAEKKRGFIEKADEIIDIALEKLKERLLSDDELPVNHLTTVIGTMYDKKALASGSPTERTEIISGDKLNKLAELAGYERKQ